MNTMPFLLCLLLLISMRASADGDVEFNTDALDGKSGGDINLDMFAKPGYVMPGTYDMKITANGELVDRRTIDYFDAGQGTTLPCITRPLLYRLSLRADIYRQARWSRGNVCLEPDSIQGLVLDSNAQQGQLDMKYPRAYEEYHDRSWEPPARWDKGVNGAFVDYDITQGMTTGAKEDNSQYTTGYGMMGGNVGEWRARSRWSLGDNHKFSTSENYLFRPLPSMEADLYAGNLYAKSHAFSSVKFTGVGLYTNREMLPPTRRDFAPEIVGTVTNDARIVVRKKGDIVYQSFLPKGPYAIRDLGYVGTGTLDVSIEENGGVRRDFQIEVQNSDLMTRPGSTETYLSAGRLSSQAHRYSGPKFVMGDVSRGINNQWSLFGGGALAEGYSATALGATRDMGMLGTISPSLTRSRFSDPLRGMKQGNSYNLSYSKQFDDGLSISLASMRYSNRNYVDVEDIGAGFEERHRDARKQFFSLAMSQRFGDFGSLFLNYQQARTWSARDERRLTSTFSKSLGGHYLHGAVLSLTAAMTESERRDYSMFVSLSMPIGNGRLSSSTSWDDGDAQQSLGFYAQKGEATFYQADVSTGSSGQPSVSGAFQHDAGLTNVETRLSHAGSGGLTGSVTLRGGITMTTKGAVAHSSRFVGGNRILIDSDDVPGVRVIGSSGSVLTDHNGLGVMSGINSYYPTSLTVDLDSLKHADVYSDSISRTTYTEGAIGYHHFDMLKGDAALVTLHDEQGSALPFGARVLNGKHQEVGIVDDGGVVYLKSVVAGDRLSVEWDGQSQCHFDFKQEQADASPLACR